VAPFTKALRSAVADIYAKAQKADATNDDKVALAQRRKIGTSSAAEWATPDPKPTTMASAANSLSIFRCSPEGVKGCQVSDGEFRRITQFDCQNMTGRLWIVTISPALRTRAEARPRDRSSPSSRNADLSVSVGGRRPYRIITKPQGRGRRP
jgi:hypothetical protein